MPCRRSDLREKKTYGYRERDEEKRLEFIERLKEKDPSQLVYLDEAGLDNRSEYAYGYSPKGERVYALKDGKRTHIGEKDGKRGLCTVLAKGNHSSVTMVLRPVR